MHETDFHNLHGMMDSTNTHAYNAASPAELQSSTAWPGAQRLTLEHQRDQLPAPGFTGCTSITRPASFNSARTLAPS